MKGLFTIILVVLTVSSPSFAEILTVHPNGPPNYGFPTISAALDAASSGDTIKIFNGVYRETYSMAASAKNWDNITIKAADGQNAVYWQNDNSNYARAGGNRWSFYGANTYRTAAGAFADGYMFAVFYEHPVSGRVWRCKLEESIQDIDTDDAFYHDASSGIVYVRIADRGLGRDPDNYIIHLNNASGNNAATLMIYENGERNINNITIDGITFQFCSLGSGSKYYKGTLATMEPYPTGSYYYDLNGLTIQNCTFLYNAHMAVSMRGTPGTASYGGPDNVLVRNCTFDSNGGWVPTAWLADNAWETIDFGYGVVRATVEDSTFDNAYRHHIAWLGPDDGSNPDVNKEAMIQRNIFRGGANYGTSWGHCSAAGIRIAGKAGKIAVKNNIIVGMGSHGIVQQHNPNNGSKEVYIYNNTIAYNGQSGGNNIQNVRIHTMPTDALEIKGNIIWGLRGGTEHRYEIFVGGPIPGDGRDINYNCVDSEGPDKNHYPIFYDFPRKWSEWKALSLGGYSPDSHSIDESYLVNNNYPNFLDNQTHGSGDYHIHENSPCIDRSLPNVVIYDVDKEERFYADIGADEYTGNSGDMTPPDPPSGLTFK